MKALAMMSLARVSNMVASREISPVDLVEACLSRINKYNATYNSFLLVLAEDARRQAKKLEKELADGHYRGRLHGIPIGLKDMYETKGIRTTAGSLVLEDFVPSRDATVVERLKEAGAIILGKNNTAEFAIGATTAECPFGASRNPWNPEKITGGSSGGSAVATVTGMAYLSMGTDTGGSVRIPPALCGCVGFKPTTGLISIYGIIPCGVTYDCAGPITRSVADAAITLDYITGPDDKDLSPNAMNPEPTHFYDAIKNVKDLRGKVIAVPTNEFFEFTDYPVEEIFNATIKKLEELGADVRKVEFPIPLKKVNNVSMIGMYGESAWYHKNFRSTKKHLYQPGTDYKLDNGNNSTAVEYFTTVMERQALKADWQRFMKDYDVMIVPTCPHEAFDISIGRPWMIMTRGQEEMGEPMNTWHTRLASVVNAPALTIPMGLTPNGLPTGMMIMGSRGNDKTVLEVGLAYERNYEYPVWMSELES